MPENKNATKKGRVSKPLLAAIIATILLIIFIVVALLLAPGDLIPEFSLTDQNGDWDAQAQGKIAVFDKTIEPGSKGEYDFIITNETAENLKYGFKLTEYLNTSEVTARSFMKYRLKVDNVYLDDGEWRDAGFKYFEYNPDSLLDYNGIKIISGTKHLMTLEWWWPYEIDDVHDQNDTLIGVAGGELSIHIFIWAEVAEEIIW